MDKIITIVTGATSGIGRQTAIKLLGLNHHLILANRNQEKAKKLQSELLERYPEASIDFLTLDLASFSSIEQFIKTLKQNYPKIDNLINNAGVLARTKRYTKEGFEVTLGVNHIGTYLLTKRFLEAYQDNLPNKIIMVSSIGCYWGNDKIKPSIFTRRINTFKNYFDSKLANLIMAKELADQYRVKGLLIQAADPGVVYSKIWKWKTAFGRSFEKLQKLIMKSPEEGANVIIKLVTTNTFDKDLHILFTLKKGRKLPRRIRDKEVRRRYFEYTEETIEQALKKSL